MLLRYNFVDRSEHFTLKKLVNSKIEQIEISKIKPYENNPRINDEAVEYVANSIKEFGFKVPLVLDADFVIVCGHTRYKAAQELGLEKLPCIVASDLTPEQVKAFRLAENKTGELAEWDFELLEQELAALDDFEIDFDMESFGFEDIENERERDYNHIQDLLESGLNNENAKTEKDSFSVSFVFPVEHKEAVMDAIAKKSKEYFVNLILSEVNGKKINEEEEERA